MRLSTNRNARIVLRPATVSTQCDIRGVLVMLSNLCSSLQINQPPNQLTRSQTLSQIKVHTDFYTANKPDCSMPMPYVSHMWNNIQLKKNLQLTQINTVDEYKYKHQQYNYKKAHLSLTNPRDAKACQKLLQFDMLTTLSLTILFYLHSFSCCCVRNLRNPKKFTENSNL